MNIRVMALVLCCADAVLAQERPLEPMVQGTLLPGVPQVYTVRAAAGDVISGTFEMKDKEPTPTLTIAFYDENGATVKEQSFRGGPLRIGFVVPANGAYRIRITATIPAGGPYTLRTEKQTPAEWMAGAVAVTPVVSFKSARIDQLAKDVNAGQAGAVERFWAEAETRGGPLIENMEGNDQFVLATFLWKEIYETHNVLVIWPGAPREDNYMSHVPGTNVWYKTVRVFRGSRFEYELAPNDHGGVYLSQKDPLNPRSFSESSVLETPDAPDESWYRRTPAVRGTIRPYHVDSALLKATRDISVYTPPGYAPSNGPYPLLILFDGDAYVDNTRLGAPNTLDNLIAEHRIRPTVVCFVSDNRSNFSRNPEQEPIYAAAMATELVPWLRSSHAVSKDPKDVVIGGYSAGARAAAYSGMHYPKVFGNLLLQSGGGDPNLVIDSPKAPLRIYMDVGLYEDPWDSPYTLYVWLEKGYDVIYRETAGAHQGVHWAATLAEGLIALLGQTAK